VEYSGEYSEGVLWGVLLSGDVTMSLYIRMYSRKRWDYINVAAGISLWPLKCVSTGAGQILRLPYGQ